jgi:hypothetical protein
MKGSVQLFALLVAASLSGCAPQAPRQLPGGAPSAGPSGISARAAELRTRLEGLATGPTSAEEEEQAELERHAAADQAEIASISSRLQTSDADLAARKQVLEFSARQESEVRLEQLRQTGTALELSKQQLAARTNDLQVALGPSGTSWDPPTIMALDQEIARLQNEIASLQRVYEDLSVEQQQALEASVAAQDGLIDSWRQNHDLLEGELAQVKSDLESTKGQSQQIASGVAERQAQADNLRAELRRIGG